MKKSIIYITLIVLNLFGYSVNAQTDTEFWFIKPNITQEHTNETFKIVFTTREFAADIKIEMPAEPLFTPVTFSVAAYTTYTYTVVQPSALFTLMENSTVVDELSVALALRDNIGNKAILVTSTAPINAYLTQTATNNSDIYALKGGNGIGTEFIIPFQEHGYNMHPAYNERAFSSIDIISYEDGTVVQIIPPTGRSVFRNGTFQNQTLPYTVTLNRGQVYTCPPGWDPSVIRNYVDLNGGAPPPPTWDTEWWAVDGNKHLGGIIVKVITGEGVAVVKKDDSVRKYTDGGWDEIGDQWVPYKGIVGENNDILGTEYVAMRGNLDNGWEWVYVAAPENNTRIWWGYGVDTSIAPVNAVINRGQQQGIQFNKAIYTTGPPDNFNFMEIISNKPLSVLHVSGIGKEMGGAVLPPISKCTGSTSVSFSRDISWPLYINIMTRAGAEGDFLINGVVRNDIIDPAKFYPVGTTGDWVATQIYYANGDVTDFPVGTVRTISNTNDVFHIGLINGNSTGGCRYGYFSDFNELTVSANTIQGDGTQPSSTIRACKGDTVQLYASGGSVFNWWPSTNLSSTTVSNPKAVVDDFRTYFVEVSGACNNKDTATVTIEMAEQPDAVFFMEKGQGCAPLEMEIRNLSTDVNQIYWDYNTTGIGGTLDRDTTKYHPSVIKDVDSTFTHTFFNTSFEPIDSPEIYHVRLKVKATKCTDVFSTTVKVYPEITADFTLSDLNDTLSCNPAIVDFQSSVLSINEDFYKWSFGDGALSGDANPTHEYTNIQLNSDTTYTAELVVRSQWFCRDTARQDFTVHPYLESGFTIDVDKGCSPLTVNFTNTSAGEDRLVLVYGDGTANLDVATFGTVPHVYRNTGTTVLKRPVVLRAYNDEGCIERWRDTITVYPEFKATYNPDVPSYSGCNSQVFNFTNTTPQGADIASQFLWTFGDGTNLSTTAVPVPHTYTNTTSADKTYTFNLHAESVHGCTDDTTRIISIYRAYSDFTIDDDEGCSPLPVTVTNTSIGAQIATWAWNFGDATTSNVQNPVPNPHIYTNTTGATQVRNLRLTVTGTNGCSTFKQIPVDVFSSVDLTFTPAADQTDCDSLVVPFNSTINPVIAGTTYLWNFGDGTSSSAADPPHVYRNLTNAGNVTYNAQVTATTPSGCTDSESRNITIRPYVNAKFTADKVAGCSPLSVNTIATTYIGIPVGNYRWTYGDGYNPVMSNPPAHTYPANPPGGNDIWTLRLDVSDPSGLCTDFATKTITVYDEALADFNPKNSTNCNEYTITFSNLSLNAATYKWDFDDLTSSSAKNPTHTFTNDDHLSNEIYNVELEVTSDEGCKHVFTSPVNVLPRVISDFDVDISEGCSPLDVTISNNSFGTQFYWYWDKDDRVIDAGVLAAADSTTNSANFIKTYVNNSGTTRTDSLTLIVGNGNGCYAIFKRAIKVYSTIDAQFTVNPASEEGCNPLTVTFTNATVNGSVYNWTFGDGSSTTTASPIHQFINTTTSDKNFPVRMDAESVNGCTDYLETTIQVYSKVISDFSIETSEGCPPFTTTIDNTSIGNNANTYQWLIDNVPVGGSPTNTDDFNHLYANTVNSTRDYVVKLIATNPHGCTSEHSDIVKVYEYVEASYSMDQDNSCSPLDVVFTDSSYVPASTKYIWDFGDGATSGLQEPTHRFYNSSRTSDLTRTIHLTVQSANYCSDDTSMTVEIFHNPLAKFFIDKTSSCPPLVSTLVKESQGEDSFEWRFDDGNPINTTEAYLTYSWPNTDIDNIQIYNLELWVGTTNNCKDSTSLDLSVFPFVVADYTIGKDIGCSPLKDVQFTNASTLPATQFFWSFGDGSTTNLENPKHDFANIGFTDRTYDVFFRASSEYNCWDTITKQVTVFVQPDAEFYADPQLLIFPDNIVALDNKTNSGPFDYLWEFGNMDLSTSNVEEPGNFEYEHWGEKVIELSVTSQTNTDCFDYYVDTITILPPNVNADFITNINGGCLNDGLEVQFTAAGSVYNEEYQYDWEFGDGGTASGQYVNHTYETAGVYYVRLTARSTEYTSVEEDYAYKTIRVYSNPVANFEVSPKLAMLNIDIEARVEFFNMSECNDTSGCAYVWHFGDGGTAISRDVTHNYTELGKYDVSLYVTTANGCKDSLILIEEVEIIGAGEIAFPNAFTPNGDGLNDTFRPVSEGVIKYELLVYNRWGELIFTTKDLSAGWNGTIKGEYAKPDVYVWKAMGNFTNGRSFELAGDVTLIR